jgi:hypothetical protein
MSATHTRTHTCKLVFFSDEAAELHVNFFQPLRIGAIDHVYEGVGVVEVVSPIWPNLSLTSDIPNIELEAIFDYALDVEPLCGHDAAGS